MLTAPMLVPRITRREWLAALGVSISSATLDPARLAAAGNDDLWQTDVFVAGQEGYHTYRIPALVRTTKDTLLAFCEGRKNNRRDHGDIDLVLKHSSDGGRTWSRQQVVYEEGGSSEVTIGNPAPVVDQDTGVIWLPFCRDNDRVLITHSSDDGLTWTQPIDITADVKEPDWTWYATGPVNGIQLRRPPHKGRLVIPCDHRVGGAENPWNHAGRSHAIYSDDHGKSWQLSKATEFAMNECTVVERSDGTLLLNMRSYRGRNRRAVATSEDGGITWSASRDDPKLIEPVCQGSMIRYTWPDVDGPDVDGPHDNGHDPDGKDEHGRDQRQGEHESGAHAQESDGHDNDQSGQRGKSRILFSNPDSKTRDHMTVRLSYDEGKSWPVSRLLHEGPAAYSGLCKLPDQTIGNLYERGSGSPYERITFARFTLEWLTRGKDRPRGYNSL